MSGSRQVARFAIAGVLATLSDGLVYLAAVGSGLAAGVHGLLPGAVLAVVPEPFDLAKAASFFVGTLVSYGLNKLWTFERPERDVGEAVAFFTLYGLTFVLNVIANHLALDAGLALGASPALAGPLAFVVATGCSTVVNFLGQKFWVFAEPGAAEDHAPPS